MKVLCGLSTFLFIGFVASSMKLQSLYNKVLNAGLEEMLLC